MSPTLLSTPAAAGTLHHSCAERLSAPSKKWKSEPETKKKDQPPLTATELGTHAFARVSPIGLPQISPDLQAGGRPAEPAHMLAAPCWLAPLPRKRTGPGLALHSRGALCLTSVGPWNLPGTSPSPVASLKRSPDPAAAWLSPPLSRPMLSFRFATSRASRQWLLLCRQEPCLHHHAVSSF
jgi:hypothetical protein